MSKENVEDIYPLSPMQQGMFFHHALFPESQAYLEQTNWDLRGPLDPAAFEQAWQYVVGRHAILRTIFVSKGPKTLQVVRKQLPMPIVFQDWRALPPTEQERRFCAYRESDRRRGFML